MSQNPSSIEEQIRVVVVLDDPLATEVIRLTLAHGPYVVRHASDVEASFRILAEWQPHLAVVDMEVGGSRFLREIDKGSEESARIPVIGLTRRGDLKAKLAAFDQGVDDILVMPLSPEELLARVVALTRRTLRRRVEVRPVLNVGDLELDILNHRVRVGFDELHLTGLEQNLLYLLASNAGLVITRDQIVDALWGVDFVAGSNVVDQHIRGLRTKLQDVWRNPRFIATVPGRGYRFIPHDPSVEAGD